MKLYLSTYELGATVATRLVNTSATVRREGGEELTSAAALGRFLHDLDVDSFGRPTVQDLGAVLALRADVRGLLGADREEAVVAGANGLLRRAGAAPVLDRGPGGQWRWYLESSPGVSTANLLAFVVGTGVLGVVRALGHDRLRACEAPDCAGMFVDTSRAGRRRFCTPELCGNRLNVANHRARRRAR